MVYFTAADCHSSSVTIDKTPCWIVGIALDGNDDIAFDMVNDPTMADTAVTILQKYEVIGLWGVFPSLQAPLSLQAACQHPCSRMWLTHQFSRLVHTVCFQTYGMDEGCTPRKAAEIPPSVIPLNDDREDRVTAFSDIRSKYTQEVIRCVFEIADPCFRYISHCRNMKPTWSVAVLPSSSGLLVM